MKDNFFIKFKNCLHRLDKFPAYIDQGIGKAIKYGFLISLIFGGIIGIYNSFSLNTNLNTTIQQINKPEYRFTVKDNTLDLTGGPYKFNSNGIGIYINDNKTLDDAQSVLNDLSNNTANVLVLKNGIDLNLAGQSQTATYNTISQKLFNSGEITNQSLTGKIQGMKKYYFIFQFVFEVINRFINLIMDSLIITIVGLIASMIMGMMVKPAALYSLSVYAATVPFLISLPISILYPSIPLQYPIMLGTAIYVVIILKHIKDDLVKRQKKSGGKINNRINKFL
ncbi:DUF1189 domain-containing protein [uncultured Clostridium sp.]|uniref:DUF1189 domain-containing protein n=1 Tax=uncultured Clostridium sp. TaxID=59620 RepID=UPI00262C8561|nr:DUF1189 domain-containing protein [uncultured Clostridium sp.]